MLEKIEAAPPDAILGLTQAFREDSRASKVNLSVGVYQDESGKTPLLGCVQEIEQRLAAEPGTKSYLPIPGLAPYNEAVQELIFGADCEAVANGCVAAAQTPGGTGALRVAGDLIRATLPTATLWLSEPTWPNHPNIFAASGLPQKTYAYFDAASNSLDLEGMLAAIRTMPAGDVILLHGCCHNPTGVDPTPQQWEQIADAVRQQGLLPLLDFAYQGFAEGIEEDAAGLRAFCRPGAELMVCSSFSKNFSLYRERVGGLLVAACSADSAAAVQSQINRVIRCNYSNPPAHGAEIVNGILRDDRLRPMWQQEVAQMRDRINGMRKQFAQELAARGVPGDYSFITRQRGMFSYSGLSKPQVDLLREKFGIYIVGSGRINVAGLTPSNVGLVAEAIGEVMAQPA